MLAIRLKRVGRTNHAQYRVIVQDSHRHPTRGKVVSYVGTYNPHNKQVNLDKEQIDFYLNHGAQPSDRIARLLKNEGIKLPKWVSIKDNQKRSIRNAEKLRKNQPATTDGSEAGAVEKVEPTKESPEADSKPDKPAKDEKSESQVDDPSAEDKKAVSEAK